MFNFTRVQELKRKWKKYMINKNIIQLHLLSYHLLYLMQIWRRHNTDHPNRSNAKSNNSSACWSVYQWSKHSWITQNRSPSWINITDSLIKHITPLQCSINFHVSQETKLTPAATIKDINTNQWWWYQASAYCNENSIYSVDDTFWCNDD